MYYKKRDRENVIYDSWYGMKLIIKGEKVKVT